ncbi:MAG: type II secretion system protein GspL [Pseudomonadales bacterium]|nr:type II secretion system protein GspL [Pseudomonadales bacterium]
MSWVLEKNMSDFLCLRFKDINLHLSSEIFWTALSNEGQISSSGCAQLEDLGRCVSEAQHSQKVVLIAPTEALLLTEVEVPKAQQRHLNQVLAFVAEEQIIEPIESMHLALPMLFTGDNIPLAVVKKSLLKSWLGAFELQGFLADFLFPDVLCVPDTMGDKQIFLDYSRVLFRYSATAGIAVDESLALSMLQLKLGSMQAETARLDEANLEAASDLYPFALLTAAAEPQAESVLALDDSLLDESDSEAELNAMMDRPSALLEPIASAPPVVVPLSDQLLPRLKSTLDSAQLDYKEIQYTESLSDLLAINAVRSFEQSLNLLQGDFRPKSDSAGSRRIIKKTSLILSAVLGLFMLVTLGGGSYLNYQADQYYADSVSIYKALFPQQRRVIDPIKQLRRQLRGQIVGGTTSEFLPLLDAASEAMSSLELTTSAVISQLRYDAQRGQVVIDIRAENIDVLEAYKQKMVEQGLKVDILSANQNQGMINGRIQISQT